MTGEDYCTDCGRRLLIKAFFKCVECYESWMESAAARHNARDLS
jgi:hypothetical protein